MALRVEFDLREQAGILERPEDFPLKNRLEIDGSLKSVCELHLQTIISDGLGDHKLFSTPQAAFRISTATIYGWKAKMNDATLQVDEGAQGARHR